MGTVSCFILSKDRAFQTDGLIRSLKKNVPPCQNYTVLLKEAEEFKANYTTMLEEQCSGDEWSIVLDNDFHHCFLRTLKRIADKYDYILACTDDTIFYREMSSTFGWSHYLTPFNIPSVLTIQLRLGLNTTNQDPNDSSKKIQIPHGSFTNGYTVWDWTAEPEDRNTGYPISLDGNLYRSKDLLELSERIEFKNLREWEGNLMGLIRSEQYLNEQDSKPLMACFKNSYSVNLAYNFVQPPNYPEVGPYGISARKLNDMYSKGSRMDFENMFKNIEVNGSHMFLPIDFTKL